MKRLDTKRQGLTLYHAEAGELLASLEPASVDLILTDPPYYRVKDEPWDRQWDTPEGFLAWVRELCGAWRRALKPNGSLYVFASPQMAARVECVVREGFNVLNHITWRKPEFSTKAEMFRKEDMRGFFPASERIIFAEHQGSDEIADAASGLSSQKADALRAAFGAPLRRAMDAARVSAREVTEAIGAYATVNHGGAVSNWLLGYNEPTPEQWDRLFCYFESLGCGAELLGETARPESCGIEAARAKYVQLRRPFQATDKAPYTDVWDFPTVSTYPGKHPCEKPVELLSHIITTSSREGATVLDCFCGSGSTGEAALSLGRQFIGCDASEHWSQYALARLERRFGAMPVTVRKPAKKRAAGVLSLSLEVA